MGFIVSGVLAAVAILFQYKNKTWVNPASIMNYLWAVVSAAASLRLFSLFDVSYKTWIVILLGNIAFSIGTTLKIVLKKNTTYLPKYWASSSSFITTKMFWLFFAILSILLVASLKTSIDLMNKGYGLDVIRQATMGASTIDGYVYNSSTIAYYSRYLQGALQAIVTASGIELFFSEKKNNIKYMIAVIFITVADAFSDGGRWVIMYTSIEFVIAYRITKYRKGNLDNFCLSKRAKFLLVLAIIAMIVAMDKVTTSRLGGGFIQHFYVYLCGCVPFLDTKIKFLERNQFYTVFFTSQYGIWSFIAPYIKLLTGKYGPIYTQAMEIMANTQVYEYIGSHQTYNAFVSSFYYLYADLRWIGVVGGMLVFGIIAGNYYSKAINRKKESETSPLVPYLIIAQMILKSIQSFPLCANSYVTTIILMIALFKIQNNKYSIKK